MELLTPGYEILFWWLLSFALLVLTIVAVVRLVKSDHLDGASKIFWLLLIVCIPVAGLVIFFVFNKRHSVASPDAFQGSGRSSD